MAFEFLADQVGKKKEVEVIKKVEQKVGSVMNPSNPLSSLGTISPAKPVAPVKQSTPVLPQTNISFKPYVPSNPIQAEKPMDYRSKVREVASEQKSNFDLGIQLSSIGGDVVSSAVNVAMNLKDFPVRAFLGFQAIKEKQLAGLYGGNLPEVAKSPINEKTFEGYTNIGKDFKEKQVDQRHTVKQNLKKRGELSPVAGFLGDVAGGAVQMIPMIASNLLVPGSGLGVMSAQVYSGAFDEAVKEGAELDDAFSYAVVSSAIETGTEMMFGGVPGMPKGVVTKKLEKVLTEGVGGIAQDVLMKFAKTQQAKDMIILAVDVLGEGFEEYIAEVLGSATPALYKDIEKTPFEAIKETAWSKEAFYAGLVGASTSAFMQLGKYATVKVIGEQLESESALALEPQQQIELAQAFAQKAGVELVFADLGTEKVTNKDGQQEEMNINGFYSKKENKIYLNVNSKKPLLFTLSHEITHTLEGTEGFKDMRNFVLENTYEQESFGAEKKRITELYEKMGDVDVNEDYVLNEMFADRIGMILLNDADAIIRLSRRSPGIANKIRSALVKAHAGLAEDARFMFIDQIEKMYRTALEANQQKPQMESLNTEGSALTQAYARSIESVAGEPVRTFRSVSEYHRYNTSMEVELEPYATAKNEYDRLDRLKFDDNDPEFLEYAQDVDGYDSMTKKQKMEVFQDYIQNSKEYYESNNNEYYEVAKKQDSEREKMKVIDSIIETLPTPLAVGTSIKSVSTYLTFKTQDLESVISKLEGATLNDSLQEVLSSGEFVLRISDHENSVYAGDVEYNIKRNNDKKYSLELNEPYDVDGNALSKDQSDYFKNTHASLRDERGRLKIAYHGSNEAGKFFEFTGKIAGNHMNDTRAWYRRFADAVPANFYTTDRKNAESYAHSREAVQTRKFNTFEEVKSFFEKELEIEDIEFERIYYVESDWYKNDDYEIKPVGQLKDLTAGMLSDFLEESRIAMFDSRQEALDYINEENNTRTLKMNPDDVKELYRLKDEVDTYFLNYKGLDSFTRNIVQDYISTYGEPGGVYEGYLKIEKPYVYDAKGKHWSDLEFKVDSILENQEISKQFDEETYKNAKETFKKYIAEELKMDSEYEDGYMTNDIVYIIGKINQFMERYHILTSDGEVKFEPFDGVVFSNIIDVGGNSEGDWASDVYVAFNSNQYKALNNRKPTQDPDVRYSLDIDNNEINRKLVQGFKLEVVDVINNKIKDGMTAFDAKNILSKSIKKEEYHWSGLEAYFESAEDKTKVTKADLINTIALNLPSFNVIEKQRYRDYSFVNEEYRENVFTIEASEYVNFAYQQAKNHYSNLQSYNSDVLAHVRAGKVYLMDDSKSFLIDEIQSDHHQQGRKRGYVSTKDSQKYADVKKEYELKILERENKFYRYKGDVQENIIETLLSDAHENYKENSHLSPVNLFTKLTDLTKNEKADKIVAIYFDPKTKRYSRSDVKTYEEKNNSRENVYLGSDAHRLIRYYLEAMEDGRSELAEEQKILLAKELLGKDYLDGIIKGEETANKKYKNFEMFLDSLTVGEKPYSFEWFEHFVSSLSTQSLYYNTTEGSVGTLINRGRIHAKKIEEQHRVYADKFFDTKFLGSDDSRKINYDFMKATIGDLFDDNVIKKISDSVVELAEMNRKFREDLAELGDEMATVLKGLKFDEESVRDLPLKGRAWVDYALKHSLKTAVNEGYNNVSITLGDTHTVRYYGNLKLSTSDNFKLIKDGHLIPEGMPKEKQLNKLPESERLEWLKKAEEAKKITRYKVSNKNITDQEFILYADEDNKLVRMPNDNYEEFSDFAYELLNPGKQRDRNNQYADFIFDIKDDIRELTSVDMKFELVNRNKLSENKNYYESRYAIVDENYEQYKMYETIIPSTIEKMLKDTGAKVELDIMRNQKSIFDLYEPINSDLWNELSYLKERANRSKMNVGDFILEFHRIMEANEHDANFDEYNFDETNVIGKRRPGIAPTITVKLTEEAKKRILKDENLFSLSELTETFEPEVMDMRNKYADMVYRNKQTGKDIKFLDVLKESREVSKKYEAMKNEEFPHLHGERVGRHWMKFSDWNDPALATFGYYESAFNDYQYWLDTKKKKVVAETKEREKDFKRHKEGVRGVFRDVYAKFDARIAMDPQFVIDNIVDGASGEQTRFKDMPINDQKRIDVIAESMSKNGYDVRKPISLFIAHDGLAYIFEGNHRLWASRQAGVDAWFDIRYFDGGHFENGVFNPDNVTKYAKEYMFNDVLSEKMGRDYYGNDVYELVADLKDDGFDLRFSLDDPNDLVVLHNVSDNKLRDILDLGGMAVPSLAITKADIEFTNFGKITLVMNPDIADPRKTPVFERDGYTAVFPSIHLEIESKKINDIASEIYELIDDAKKDKFKQLIFTRDKNNLISELARYTTGYMVKTEETLQYSIVEIENPNEFQQKILDAIKNNPNKIKSRYEIERIVEDEMNLRGERRLIDESKERFTYSGTRKSYLQWTKPYTLDSAVSLMKRQSIAGAEEGFVSPVWRLTALISRRFENINEIKSEKKKLSKLDETKQKEFENIAYEKFSDTLQTIDSNWLRYNLDQSIIDDVKRFGLNYERIAQENAKYHKFDHEEFKTKMKDLVDYLKQTPTYYFEAKPQRAVGLNEVEYALLPSGEYDDIRQALQERGIEVIDYSDEKSRTEIIKNLDDVKFSLDKKRRFPNDPRYKEVAYVLQKYKYDDDFDRKVMKQALDVVKGKTIKGFDKRTKEQWLDVARFIGIELKGKTSAEIDKYAVQVWHTLRPNDSTTALNRAGERFVPFMPYEWIDAVFAGAEVERVKPKPRPKKDLFPEFENKDFPDMPVFEYDDADYMESYMEEPDPRSDAEFEEYRTELEPTGYQYLKENERKKFNSLQSLVMNDAVLDEKDLREYNRMKNKMAREAFKNEIPVVPEVMVSEEVVPVSVADVEKSAQERKKKIRPEKDVRKHERTIAEALKDPEVSQWVKDTIDAGGFDYTVNSDEGAINRAKTNMGSPEEGYIVLSNKINSGQRITKDDVALAELLIIDAKNNKDYKKVQELIIYLSQIGTELGQSVQAMSLIKKLTPEGQLKALHNTLTRMKNHYDRLGHKVEINFTPEEIARSKPEKGKTVINVDQKLIEKLFEQQTFEGMADVMDQMKDNVAEQMPVTFIDKLNAWRYLSMLGNPRTHIRNILGNSMFVPLGITKDLVATGLEAVFVDKQDRTKSVLTPKDKELKKFAETDFEGMKDVIQSGTKFSGAREMELQKRIFKNDALEWIREVNFNALEAEDLIFLKSHYVRSLAMYLKAQGQDANNVDQKVLEKAREYAVQEAKRMTFRDASDLANLLNHVERQNKAGSLMLGALVPFKKTPINIIKRGIEYSPLGLTVNLTADLYRLSKKKITATQFIENISRGMTGSMIALMGAFLASAGFLDVGDDDESTRERAFGRVLGKQTYSIKAFGGTYTIDWMVPAVMPLVIGGMVEQSLNKEYDVSLLNAGGDAFTSILDPVFELTMLQGITSVLQSYNSSGAGKIGDVVSRMASNYIGQFFPTLFGQVARTIDPVRRSTAVAKGGFFPATVEKTFKQLLNKLPITSTVLNYFDLGNEPMVDVWGQEVRQSDNMAVRALMNMVSPGFFSKEQVTNINNEVKRLYDVTGEGSVLPRSVPKSFTQEGKTYRLDNKQYTEFAKTMGETSSELLDLMTYYNQYSSLTDEAKAKMVSNVYEYSYQLARAKLLESKGEMSTNSTYLKIVEAGEAGVGVIDYFMMKEDFENLEPKRGRSKKEEFIVYLKQSGYQAEEIVNIARIIGQYKVTKVDVFTTR